MLSRLKLPFVLSFMTEYDVGEDVEAASTLCFGGRHPGVTTRVHAHYCLSVSFVLCRSEYPFLAASTAPTGARNPLGHSQEDRDITPVPFVRTYAWSDIWASDEELTWTSLRSHPWRKCAFSLFPSGP
jgi:hypothetical protein